MKPILFLVLVLGLVLGPIGCAGPGSAKPTPQAVAYFTLHDTWQAVDAGMKIYADRCAKGKVSAKDQEEIDSAHEKFRLAFKSAVRLARHDWSGATPETVQKLSDELLALIAIIKL